VIQIVIALYAWMAARAGVFRPPRPRAPGRRARPAAGGTAAPIAYYMFGGATAGGVTAVTTVLRFLGAPLRAAVFVSSMSTDLLSTRRSRSG
jgi:hypothetical protein